MTMTMNDYEARRQARIKQNQQLLAQLDIKPLVPPAATAAARHSRGRNSAKHHDPISGTYTTDNDDDDDDDDGNGDYQGQSSPPPPKKKRRVGGKPHVVRNNSDPIVPARSSARIAAAPVKSYVDDGNPPTAATAISLPRSGAGVRKKNDKRQLTQQQRKKTRGGKVEDDGDNDDLDLDSLIPSKTVLEIQQGWTSWTLIAPSPTRNENSIFHFDDFPLFTPNKSPEEMLREGAFGGSYYRPLRSRKLGVKVENDWRELPPSWLEGLSVERYVAAPEYDASVNKFGVACGQSIEEWEAAGWISHEHDVRGWFQWYTRFFQGRRCDDDDRQVSRWRKCVGPTGRWRSMLLKKYRTLGVREVWDDGEDEEGLQVSPVMHQTCHHWAFEVRQQHLDEMWAGG